MRDSTTGRSRGFGFLTFKDPKTVNTVMVKEHFLDGKIVRATHVDDSRERQERLGFISRKHSRSMKRKYKDLLCGSQIDPKRAIPRDEQEKTAKIFVGGVSQDATEEDFENFFAQFGRVIDATLMMDKDTGRPRGFGFVTFDSDAAVEKCLQYYPLEILGKPIEVKRAQPRGKMGEDEDFGGRGRGRGKFGREDRFSNDGNQAPQTSQSQNPSAMGANSNGMTPQMMAQYWQRMQQYFSMMQQQMAANMMGGMGGMGNMGMNPQMMAQMQMMQQQQQKMQGGNSPNSQNANMANMQGMNPQMMQQMMNMQQGGMNGMNMGGGNRPPTGPAGPASTLGVQQAFSPQEQLAFEQRKYEQQQHQRQGSFPAGPRRGGFQGQGQVHGGGPQSWEGMYDDVPQPEGGGGGGRGSAGPVRNNTPKPPKGPGGTAQASAAPVNAPTGPKNPGKPPMNFRGGGRGRFHPYGR